MPATFKFVTVLVEGYTEERFIKDVLNPYLKPREIHLTPTILNTKITKTGPNFKGGIGSYRKVENDLRPLLGDSSASMTTTMFDLYALPSDFPGYAENFALKGTPRARAIEAALKNQFDNPNFHPYLSVHEFEALLFADLQVTSSVLNSPKQLPELQKIRNAFKTPEDINDEPSTCPSSRIVSLFDDYQKPLHGTLCTKQAGIDTLRAACPHFNSWVTSIEAV